MLDFDGVDFLITLGLIPPRFASIFSPQIKKDY
jgi:hypothetical protein